MVKKRRLIILILLLFHFFVKGQAVNHTLNGSLYLLSGDRYPYQLVFHIDGNIVVGYSITKWSNGVEPRVKIKGVIDMKQHTLSYAETSVITALPLAGNLCFVNTKLNYILRGKKYFMSGTFQGKDKNGKACGEGAIEFEEPYVPGSLFYPDTATKKTVRIPIPQKQKDTTALPSEPSPTDEIVNGYHKITEGVPKYLSWNTSYCSLKIWDGGVIDGDKITVLLNGKEILVNHTLTKNKKQLFFQLPEKVNTITIVAGDEGSASPNTAQMILNDGPIEHKIMTFNKEGKTASIIITKKQA